MQSYENEALQKKISKNYANLAIEAMIHSLYFNASLQESRKKQFYIKKKYIFESKLFELTAGIICREQRNFDVNSFRKRCYRVLLRNYIFGKVNSRFAKRIGQDRQKTKQIIDILFVEDLI